MSLSNFWLPAAFRQTQTAVLAKTGSDDFAAASQRYRLELKEPDSPEWMAIRALLADKAVNQEAMDEWSRRLADMSRSTHRVPAKTIRGWMNSWRLDLTVDRILAQ